MKQLERTINSISKQTNKIEKQIENNKNKALYAKNIQINQKRTNKLKEKANYLKGLHNIAKILLEQHKNCTIPQPLRKINNSKQLKILLSARHKLNTIYSGEHPQLVFDDLGESDKKSLARANIKTAEDLTIAIYSIDNLAFGGELKKHNIKEEQK